MTLRLSMTSSSAASVPFTVTVRTSGAVSTLATVTVGTLPAGSAGAAADDCTPHAASVTANRATTRAARNRWSGPVQRGLGRAWFG